MKFYRIFAAGALTTNKSAGAFATTRMDGRMAGRAGEKMDGRMAGRVAERMDGRVDGRVAGRMAGVSAASRMARKLAGVLTICMLSGGGLTGCSARQNLLDKLDEVQIFKGDDSTAYRDPAVLYNEGTFHLFFTIVRSERDSIFSYTAQSRSTDLKHWSEPAIITPRGQNLDFCSPGNVVRDGDEWVLCLQTYPRPDYVTSQGIRYGNSDARLFTMRSKDLEHWSEPELIKVKGDIPVEEMGRMIDPYLLRKDGLWWCFFKQNGVSMSASDNLRDWEFRGNAESGENVCIVPLDDGSHMMLHSPSNGIGLKKSDDLLHWTDCVQTEPRKGWSEDGKVIVLGQKDWPWARGRITAGAALDCRNVKGVGCWLMFFHGSGPLTEKEGDFDKNASLGLAWSENLIDWHWTKQ